MTDRNTIDYLLDTGRKTFAEKPFCVVDALILAQLSYFKFDGLVSADATRTLLSDLITHDNMEKLVHLMPSVPNNANLFMAMAQSVRFSGITAAHYVNTFRTEAEQQFAAVTFFINDIAYIAYRGTDSTLVGWKEDFNMSFLSVVPSQQEAVRYLSDVATSEREPLFLGGHSKGGNLAEYAAMFTTDEIRSRIREIYTFDGPGFRNEVYESGKYAEVCDRVTKIMPHSSVIGMILQHPEKHRVVRSNRFWIEQHDPYSWCLDGEDFDYMESLARNSLVGYEAMNRWLNEIDDATRKRVIDAVYNVFASTNAVMLEDISFRSNEDLRAIVAAFGEVEPETRKEIVRTIRSLLSYLFSTYTEQLKIFKSVREAVSRP